MIVTDASAVVAALTHGGGTGDRAREALDHAQGRSAPHLLDLEVASTLRRLGFAGELDEVAAGVALAQLQQIEVERYPHGPFLPRIHQLRHSITSYDAAYVALAEALDAELVTCDARLAGSNGHRARIRLID